MDLDEAVQRDAINIVADVPVTVTTASTTATQTVAATQGALIATKDLEEGGLFPEPDVTLSTSLKKLDTDGRALVNRFTANPDNGDTVTLAGTEYRISRTHQDEHSSILVMELISSSR